MLAGFKRMRSSVGADICVDIVLHLVAVPTSDKRNSSCLCGWLSVWRARKVHIFPPPPPCVASNDLVATCALRIRLLLQYARLEGSSWHSDCLSDLYDQILPVLWSTTLTTIPHSDPTPPPQSIFPTATTTASFPAPEFAKPASGAANAPFCARIDLVPPPCSIQMSAKSQRAANGAATSHPAAPRQAKTALKTVDESVIDAGTQGHDHCTRHSEQTRPAAPVAPAAQDAEGREG